MALYVMKFGGTSVGDPEKIKNVARKIIERSALGHQLIVVVSAMGKATNQLISLASAVASDPSKREMDMLLTTGEQVTMSLLAMCLENQGCPAISMTGWQAGMITEAVHGKARIKEIRTKAIYNQLNEGKVVIVAGFQGVTDADQITTLGRGGSDTTAVALAGACDAEQCEIYTDVLGVFSTDPRYVSSARKLPEISYDEMLEMANLGAGVLHPRAVEYAKNYQIPLVVRSSFSNEEGTIIREDLTLEKGLIVRGLAFEKDVTKITLQGLPNQLTTLATVFTTLAARGINVDIIIQNTTDEETTNISFTTDKGSLNDTLNSLQQSSRQLGFTGIDIESELAKVSIIGSGMVSNPGVAAKMFQTLSDNDVMVKMVSTSEIKVSTVVKTEQLTTALDKLHDAFDLSEMPAESFSK